MPSALVNTSAPRRRLAASFGVSQAECPMSKNTFACAEPALSRLPAYAIDARVWDCWSAFWQLLIRASTSGSSTM
jgi:hypothetical protein